MFGAAFFRKNEVADKSLPLPLSPLQSPQPLMQGQENFLLNFAEKKYSVPVFKRAHEGITFHQVSFT